MEANDGQTKVLELRRAQLLQQLGYNKPRHIEDLQMDVQNNYLDVILRHEFSRTSGRSLKLLKDPLDSLSDENYSLFFEQYGKLQSLVKVQNGVEDFEAALSQAKQLVAKRRDRGECKKRKRRESVDNHILEKKKPRMLVDLAKDVQSRLCEYGDSSLSVEGNADLAKILDNGRSGEYGKYSLTFLSFLMKIYPSEKLTEIISCLPGRMTVISRKISDCLQYIENWESGGRIHIEFPVTGSERDKIECLVMWDLLMGKYGLQANHKLDGASSVHDLAEKLREKWSHRDESELKKGFDSLTSNENMIALNKNTSMNPKVLSSELVWVEKWKKEVEEFLKSQETAGQARSEDQSGWEKTPKKQSAEEGEACPHPNVQPAAVGPQTCQDLVDVSQLEETLGYQRGSKGCKDDDISCPDPSTDVTRLEMLVGSTVDLEEALQKERESSRVLREALSKEKTELQAQKEELQNLQERLQNQQNQAVKSLRRKEEEFQHLLEEKKELVSKSGDASQEHLSVSKVLEETTEKFQRLIGMMRQYLAQEEPYIRQKSEDALFNLNETSGDELDDGDSGEPRQDDDFKYAIDFFDAISKKDGWYREDIRKLHGNIEKCVLEKQSLETRSNDLQLLQQQQFQRIEDQKREAHELAQEKAHLQARVGALEKELQEQTALRDENLNIIENTKNELSSLQKVFTELHQENKHATQRTAEIEEQRGQMKTEIADLRAENRRLRSEKEAISVQSECNRKIIEELTKLENEHKVEIKTLNKVNQENHALQEELLQRQAEAVQKRSEEYEQSEQERRKLKDEMESLQRKQNGLKQEKDALERENRKLSEQVQILSCEAHHSKNESIAQREKTMHLRAKISRHHQKAIIMHRNQSKRSETARKDHTTAFERKEQWRQTGSEFSRLALLRLIRIFLYHGEGPMPCQATSCEVCQRPSLPNSCGGFLDAEGIMELLRASGVLSSSAESSSPIFYPDNHAFHSRVLELMLQVCHQMAKNQVLLSDSPEANEFLTILHIIGTFYSRALEMEERYMEKQKIEAQLIEQLEKKEEEMKRAEAKESQNKSEMARWKSHEDNLMQEKDRIGLDLKETKERLREIHQRYKDLEENSGARIRELEHGIRYKQEQLGSLLTESDHARSLQQSRLALMRLIRLICYNGEGPMPCLIRNCTKCLSSGCLEDLSHHPDGRQLLDLLEENGFQRRSYTYAMLTFYSNPPEDASRLHPQVLGLMQLALGELDQSRQDRDAGSITLDTEYFHTLIQGIVASRRDANLHTRGENLLQEREDEVTERERLIAKKDGEHQRETERNVQMICKLKSDAQQQEEHIKDLLTERARREESLQNLINDLQLRISAEANSQREMRGLQEQMLCSKLALLELVQIFLLYSDKGSVTPCYIENCIACQRPVHETDFSHPPSKARVSSLLEKGGLLHSTSPLVNSDPPLDSWYDGLRAKALDCVEQAQSLQHHLPEARHFVSLLFTIGLKVRDQRSREQELEERNLEVQGLREEKERQWGATNRPRQRRALRDIFTLLLKERNSNLACYNEGSDALLQEAGLKCSSVVRALYASPVGDALSADINLPETTDLYVEYEPFFQYLEILHSKIITTPRLFEERTSPLGHSPKSTTLSCSSEEPLQQREFHGLDEQPVCQNASGSPRVHEPEDIRAQKSVPVDARMTSNDDKEAEPKTPWLAHATDENEIKFRDVGWQADEDWSGWPTGELEPNPRERFLGEEVRYKPRVTALQEELEALQEQRENQEDSEHKFPRMSIAAQGLNYPNKGRLWHAKGHTNPDEDRPSVPASEPIWHVRFLGNSWEIHGVESSNKSLLVLIHRAVSKKVMKRQIPLLSLFAMEDCKEAKSNAANFYSYCTSKGYNNIPDCVSFESATEVDWRGKGQRFRVTFREKRSHERIIAASKLAMLGSHVAEKMSPEWLNVFLESDTRLRRFGYLRDPVKVLA